MQSLTSKTQVTFEESKKTEDQKSDIKSQQIAQEVQFQEAKNDLNSLEISKAVSSLSMNQKSKIKEIQKNLITDSDSKKNLKSHSPLKNIQRAKITNEKYQGLLPKQPSSGYFQFLSEFRNNYQNQTQDNDKEAQYNIVKVTKEAAQAWTNLTDYDKHRFMKLYEKDIERYNLQVEQINQKGFFMTFDNKKSCDVPRKVKEKKINQKTQKTIDNKSPVKDNPMPFEESRKNNKLNNPVGKYGQELRAKAFLPLRHSSAYHYFQAYMMSQLSTEWLKTDGAKISQLMAKAAQEWKTNVSKEDKQAFIDRAAVDKQRFVDQTAQLKKEGFFTLHDGTLSKDYDLHDKISVREFHKLQRTDRKKMLDELAPILNDEDEELSDDSGDEEEEQENELIQQNQDNAEEQKQN